MLAKQNFNTYSRELAAIIKLTKKYSHILNTRYQSIIINNKLCIRFFNTEYHKDIFAYWANKLCLLNICTQYILGKKNLVTDGLSYVIFNNTNYYPNQLIYRLAKKVFSYQNNNK